MNRIRYNQPATYIAVGFVIAAVVVNMIINRLIPVLFPDQPIVEDLLFRFTPSLFSFQYVADLVILLSLGTTIWYALRKKTAELPFIITVFAVGELVRGFLMILTPLGPSFPLAHYGLTNYTQYGQFPSGHTVIVMVAYFLVERKTAPITKDLLLILAVVEIAALILSRGHYSIDIVGGFFVAYVTVHELQRFRKKLTLQSA